jgi:hypothetical protein
MSDFEKPSTLIGKIINIPSGPINYLVEKEQYILNAPVVVINDKFILDSITFTILANKEVVK